MKREESEFYNTVRLTDNHTRYSEILNKCKQLALADPHMF